MTTAIGKVSSKGQVTLPKAIREAAHLAKGDPVRFEVTDEGAILVRPQKMVDASQAWFWTPTWQAGEAQASADIAAGRTTVHETTDEFLAALSD